MKTDEVAIRKPLLPFQIKFEQRISDVPRWYPLVLSFAAVVVALLIGAIVLAISGGNPWATYAHIARASFGSVGVFSDTLVKSYAIDFGGFSLFCCISNEVMEYWR